MYKIGIDVGGYKTLGVVLFNNKIIKKMTTRTETQNKEKFLSDLENLINKLTKKNVEKIGLCLPGYIKNNILKKSPNLKIIENVRFDKKIVIENDANCYALGESVRLNKKNLVGITIGTGVGCGIIINKKIYHGLGNAGELGHTIIKINGRKCTCGNRGCLEEYISTRALERASKKIFGRVFSAFELRKLAEKGNKNSIKIFRKSGTYLGIGLANICNLLNPEIISLGGGLSKNKWLVDSAISEMKKNIYFNEPEIVIGKYESCAIGAANLIK